MQAQEQERVKRNEPEALKLGEASTEKVFTSSEGITQDGANQICSVAE